MDECDICGQKDSKFTIILSPIQSLNACSECMNLYTDHDYSKLIEKIEKHYK